MARIVVGSYLVQFPMGGYLSWVAQWLRGLTKLGHEVYFVEKAVTPNACFDPARKAMSDDCQYGTRAVNSLLLSFGMQDRWCFAGFDGTCHGMSREGIQDIFRTADLFIDMGTHGNWLSEAGETMTTVLVDGEPGLTQIRMSKKLEHGLALPEYDHYFTVGMLVGNSNCDVPTVDKEWHPIVDPVDVAAIPYCPPVRNAAFSSVMSWQAHEPIEFEGRTYGMKDIEFEKFVDLPKRTAAALEIAVAGANVPVHRLTEAGWEVKSAHAVSMTLEDFTEYVRNSAGEFSVCKNVFVALRTGFFSERSAFYLAHGRPVIMQETGFSACLPCGEGLFAAANELEAADALDEVLRQPEKHSDWARELAAEYLDCPRVLTRLLTVVGL